MGAQGMLTRILALFLVDERTRPLPADVRQSTSAEGSMPTVPAGSSLGRLCVEPHC